MIQRAKFKDIPVRDELYLEPLIWPERMEEIHCWKTQTFHYRDTSATSVEDLQPVVEMRACRFCEHRIAHQHGGDVMADKVLKPVHACGYMA